MSAERASLEAILGPVSRETWDRLESLQCAVERWTATSNLVAPSTLPDFWRRHVLDSAQLVPLKAEARNWVDLGSGGGFPGLVIAILLAEKPESRISLVESNAKKAAFLSAVASDLALPARIHRCRIEQARERTGAAEVVTARALAALARLLPLASPWLREGGCGLFHKGRDFVGELAKSHDEWVFDLIEHPSVVDPSGRILEISGLRPRHDVDQDQNGTSRG
jgi:16S rRNA (guanine527-N7)-methyltransferase